MFSWCLPAAPASVMMAPNGTSPQGPLSGDSLPAVRMKTKTKACAPTHVMSCLLIGLWEFAGIVFSPGSRGHHSLHRGHSFVLCCACVFLAWVFEWRMKLEKRRVLMSVTQEMAYLEAILFTIAVKGLNSPSTHQSRALDKMDMLNSSQLKRELVSCLIGFCTS